MCKCLITCISTTIIVDVHLFLCALAHDIGNHFSDDDARDAASHPEKSYYELSGFMNMYLVGLVLVLLHACNRSREKIVYIMEYSTDKTVFLILCKIVLQGVFHDRFRRSLRLTRWM